MFYAALQQMGFWGVGASADSGTGVRTSPAFMTQSAALVLCGAAFPSPPTMLTTLD
jgi:hypothetical protein